MAATSTYTFMNAHHGQHGRSNGAPRGHQHSRSASLFDTYNAPPNAHAEHRAITPPSSARRHAEKQYNGLGIYEQSANADDLDNHDNNANSNMSFSRARHRGPSDLGRPVPLSLSPVNERLSPASPSAASEFLTGILIPLPFLLASLANIPPTESCDPTACAAHTDKVLISHGALVQAGALAAATLVLAGLLARRSTKSDGRTTKSKQSAWSGPSLVQIGTRAASLWLPFYAALRLGGVRAGVVLLAATTTELGRGASGFSPRHIVRELRARPWVAAVVILGAVLDFMGLVSEMRVKDLVAGYIALFLAVAVVPLQLSSGGGRRSLSVSSSRYPPTDSSSSYSVSGASPLVATPESARLTFIAGTILAILTSLAAIVFSSWPIPSTRGLAFFALSIISGVALVFKARPTSLQSKYRLGSAAGYASLATASLVFPTGSALANASLAAATYASTLIKPSRASSHTHSHTHASHTHASHSRLTGLLLRRCNAGGVMESILRERDSRRIAYFGLINLLFMLVQFFYGFATGSLGLLTDSIHMLFDCAGLAVGLTAAVMSKWPPSASFPYGYGKVDTLSGFANGIFLVLVSVEIVFDAVHRLREGTEVRRLNELLVVSVLGLVVNVVGLTAFGHAHHGHDHGHGHGNGHSSSHDHKHGHDHGHGHSHDCEKKHDHDHGHDHGHGNGHGHSHSHDHSNNASHTHTPNPQTLTVPSPLPPSVPNTPFSMPSLPSPSPPTPPSNTHHHHDHHNENMQGIFLHILADALGSVSVIASTLATMHTPWHGWDASASVVIALLILASALPLVKTSGQKLLLTLPDEVEYKCRGVLQGVSEVPGVGRYAGVRFWVVDGAVRGVMHVVTAEGWEGGDVGRRVGEFLRRSGCEVVVHVEREGGGCWCGGGKG
ncbi:cation efflux protein [Trichodelitschia bisporula]|uniref:Zinc transporter n=1 Tax=Trichodelitschia bisporula TaxID=703511 RepID=A0A6G1I2U0_9PEZI|nr:cation efflux protein [Trichodelitschia bisporula]